MTQLTWTLDAAGTAVALRGDIDEKSGFARLVDDVKDGAVLDLSGVERINSVGVRNWMELMQALEKQGKRVTLACCAVPVVHQLNMIARFSGAATVASIKAPFLCPACEMSRVVDVDLARPVEPQIAAPVTCPKCRTAMEFDDVPASYFGFARR
jgi:anti-anti-sigma regulatory factor